MNQSEIIEKLIASRLRMSHEWSPPLSTGKSEAEGGCGVIGIVCSQKIPARHLLQSLKQMRNRGNNKGGGIAAVGLVPEELGVTQDVLNRDYLLAIAYLDHSVRDEVERNYIESIYEVDHVRDAPRVEDFRTIKGIDIQPPEVRQYFVRVKSHVVDEFRRNNGLPDQSAPRHRVEDEIVYQNSYRLNRSSYASVGEKRAFVLSHGKNMLVFKMVGYGDDVIRYYKLEDLHAHVWIGHHRYPTKGRVWHPGGAHPFVGLHEALVHNGDFANYASIVEYLAQRNIHPLFLTDTEVSVQVFDLLHRIYGYPLEYVIESLAPTTERDFTQLPADKQQIYRMLQAVHIHGSPDGPWFFLVAQSAQPEGVHRLIGITDTSMLRPQVFALQTGEASIGFAASEKQAIDAALSSLAAEDARFWSHVDRYWNARGGSHTDGGAFIFTVHPEDNGAKQDNAKLVCTDKFGRMITLNGAGQPYAWISKQKDPPSTNRLDIEGSQEEEIFNQVTKQISGWNYDDLTAFLTELEKEVRESKCYGKGIALLGRLIDRRYPTGQMRRSSLLSLFDRSLASIFEQIKQSPTEAYVYTAAYRQRPTPTSVSQAIVIDARDYPPEGNESLALEVVRLYKMGWRKFILAHTRGHRFIANGLGPSSHGAEFDVFGSSGDYLASGIDGAKVFVHGNAQDQLAQIMKDGTLVVYGDVGQTFMYAAKGGKAFVLGNAAGRPMINAVGKPRVVINGTCLDYLAESFMAGDPHNGGGFVILNGVKFDDEGNIIDLEEPYPGGNLFSLASGGAIFVRDPHKKVSDDQLNGGEFAAFNDQDWALIEPYLRENEGLFGIPISRLLSVGGKPLPTNQIYRKIQPRAHHALQAEEAWVRTNA